MKKLQALLIAPAVAGALLLASTSALGQAGRKPEQAIKWRQSAYQVIAWNSGRIKAALAADTYDKAEVTQAASTIAALANSGLDKLFTPDTASGKGWHDTSAKPEIFKDTAKFSEANAKFVEAANALAKVAAAGDAGGVKAAFPKLNQTCKGCHDGFKASD